MKKLVSSLSCFLAALSTFIGLSFSTYPTTAAEADNDGSILWTKENCIMISSPGETPNTFEAWIKLSPQQTERAGVLLGNYVKSNTGKSSINLEIVAEGAPCIRLIESDGTKTEHIFSDVDVRSEEYVHLAIAYDDRDGTFYCYLNGELKETVNLPYSHFVPITSYAIGNDRSSVIGDTTRFKGYIRSLALYSDRRTASEIKEDMNTVGKNDDSLIASYNFENKSIYENGSISSTVISDESGNGYHLYHDYLWKKKADEPENYAYSFMVVGDTQTMNWRYPEQFPDIYDYIVENAEAKKVQHVFGLGDITDQNEENEWIRAQEQISKMNGIVPYSVIRGNHDILNKNTVTGFDDYFGLDSAYAGQFTDYYQDTKNTVHEFSAGNLDYLVLALDYAPSDDVLEWANGVIEAHPDHNVIISTHAYLDSDGSPLKDVDTNNVVKKEGEYTTGVYMWENLISKHKNIVLVLCGHIAVDNIVMTQQTGDYGNTVTQLLINPQNLDLPEYVGATGMVATLYISQDGKTVTTRYYSTTRGEYFQTSNELTFTLDTVGEKEPIPDDNDNSSSSDTNHQNSSGSNTSESDRGCRSSFSSAFSILAPLSVASIIVLYFRKKKRN